MKLSSERRCPWCGEVVDNIRNDMERYHTKECACCGKKYSFYYKNNIFLFSDIIFVLLIIGIAFTMIKKWFPIILCLIFVIVEILLQSMNPYEMYDDEGIPIMKRYKAIFNFNSENFSAVELLKIRLFLMEKSIIPICFADETDNPLSHVICISVESARKISKTKYECIFSFLPLSPFSYDASKTRDFYLFDGDRKRVAKGRMTAEYSKFI